MYKLSVGTLFKNESQSIKEWIEHYLFHGVEHIYLINDSSTDNSVEILHPYIEKGIITLFDGNHWNYYVGRQKDMYNHFFLPILKETKWFLIVDMDEYMWSQQSIDLKHILDRCNHMAAIQVENTVFGSNGHISQPPSVVKGFTKRTYSNPSTEFPYGNLKYFINTSFPFTSINIHHPTFSNKEDKIHNFKILTSPYFILNHYSCQSREFWDNVKCTRGDGDNYRVRKQEDFNIIDVNEVEDLELYEQNKEIIKNVLGII